MRQTRNHWNYETCMEESHNYTTRSEFKKGCYNAYHLACKNGWLDKYTWLELQQKPHGYWNYETCMEESHKYTTRTEFQKGNRSAYHVAWKNGWLDEYTWLEIKWEKKWNYETCMEESHKYTTRTEFQKGSNGAYDTALNNGWLDEYTWLKRPEVYNKKWTYGTCMEESHKYTTRSEFAKRSSGAYVAAWKNGWIDEYIWLKRPISWNLKWTYETCMEESRNYTTRGEFQKGNVSAYNAAWKNGWLDEFFISLNFGRNVA